MFLPSRYELILSLLFVGYAGFAVGLILGVGIWSVGP